MQQNKKYIFSILIILTSSLIVFGQTTNNLITKDSVGDIKLGMTIGEAKKALPKGFKLAPGGGSEGVTFIGVFDGEKHLLDIGEYGYPIEKKDTNGRITGYELPPIDENKKITGITIVDSRFKTAEGVHVGTTIADAEKQYGKLKKMSNYPHMGEFGNFTNSPGFLRFNFRPKGEFTEAGIYEQIPDCPEDAYPPSCLKAVKYNPNSYISEMYLASPEPIQKVVSITDVPKDYKVNIYGPTECDEDNEESKTTYYISWKVPLEKGRYSLPNQRFSFEGLFPCPEIGYGEDSKTVSYKDQFDVFLDDFNFDGIPDLALRDGMNGGYGFPSYQIYLFSKEKDKFVLNPSYTELGQYQGMFEVDEKNKMIYNKSKSGAAFYQTDGYILKGDKLEKVYEMTEEYKSEDEKTVTVKKLINGKWITQK